MFFLKLPETPTPEGVVQATGGSWEEVEWLEYILPPDTEAGSEVREEPTDQGQKEVEEQ